MGLAIENANLRPRIPQMLVLRFQFQLRDVVCTTFVLKTKVTTVSIFTNVYLRLQGERFAKNMFR